MSSILNHIRNTYSCAFKDKNTDKKHKDYSIPEGNITYVLSFFTPLIILIAIYYIRDIYPFGDNCYLRSDMYHQYAPFYSEFWNKLRNGGSLSYSWDIGMGTNFTSLYAYYLASPVNFIIALFPQKYMIEVMNILIILKLSALSLSFTYYISKHFNNKSCLIALFGTFYGLSAYSAAYSWNIMWLDCIILVPLIMLGLERLINEGKGILYCITLGLCIYTNYYISIMVCISCCLYFAVLMVCTGYKNKIVKISFYLKRFLKWGLFSLLAAGLSACLLLPEFYTFSLSASSDISFPATLKSYFSALEILTRQLINIPVHLGLDHLPNIYCGTAVFLLIPLYISTKKIPAVEKICKISLLAVFFFSFKFNIPNFIWHGFHYPNSLPCRQSFIYIFFMLVLCYEAFLQLKNTDMRKLTTALWTALGLLFIIEQIFTTADNSKYNFKSVYLSGVFILLYALIILLYIKKKTHKNILLYTVFAVCIVECTVNLESTGVGTTNRTAYLSDYNTMQQVRTSLAENDTSFYRIEKLNNARSKNDGAWHNYKSISTFSSTSNAAMSDLFGFLGFEHSMNAYGSEGATKVTESLFSVKYLTDTHKNTDNTLCSLADNVSNTYIYKNEYTLSPGYLVPADINNTWQPSEANNGIQNQNSLIEAMTGISNVFTLTADISSDSSCSITPVKNGYMYVTIVNPAIDNITVSVNGSSKSYSGLKNGSHIVDLGYIKTTDIINISSDNTLQLKAYTLETNRFIEAYNILNNSSLNISSYSDTSINGSINALYDGTVMFSIPYDGGWSVYIDGKKTQTFAIKDALLGVNITSGEHEISLKYTPVNLVKGCIITFICIIILVAVILFGHYKNKSNLTWSDILYKFHITNNHTSKAGVLSDKTATSDKNCDNSRQECYDDLSGCNNNMDITSILNGLDDFDNIEIMDDDEVKDEFDNDSPYDSDTF